MGIYSRIMQGSARKPAVPRIVVFSCAFLLLVAAVVVEPLYIRALAASPTGVAAGVAIVGALIVKRFMSWTPWAFVTGALLLDVGARLSRVEAVASILSVASYLLLAAAVVVGLLQLKVTFADKAGRLALSPARWGSVIVAGGVLAGSATAELIGIPGASVEQRRLLAEIGPKIRQSTEYSGLTRVGRIQHRAITESSGLVASRSNPGYLWTHNDSGHGPVIYCLSRAVEPCGAWEVSDSSVTDWEDVAIGPGPHSRRSYLYIGDIGDNERKRESITIYRVLEPDDVSIAGAATVHSTEPANRIVLRYPDRPHDAEALIVHPHSGDIYILTKGVVAGVYKVESPIDTSEPVVLKRVAKLSIPDTYFEVTGADLSPDGQRLALSTYAAAFELILSPDADVASFDQIWHQPLLRIDVGESRQREAIAYSFDGLSLLVTSEGSRAPLHRVSRV